MTDTSLAALRRAAEQASEVIARDPERAAFVRGVVEAWRKDLTPGLLLSALSAARAEGIEEAREKVTARLRARSLDEAMGAAAGSREEYAASVLSDEVGAVDALLAKGGAR